MLRCDMADDRTITQNPDIRFLGRLLGNVIRHYGGDALFRRTEYIRSASVDRHRGIADAEAIDPGLHALTLDGQSWHKPWLPESFALHGGTLHFTLQATHDKNWGSEAADSPPSFPPPAHAAAEAR